MSGLTNLSNLALDKLCHNLLQRARYPTLIVETCLRERRDDQRTTGGSPSPSRKAPKQLRLEELLAGKKPVGEKNNSDFISSNRYVSLGSELMTEGVRDNTLIDKSPKNNEASPVTQASSPRMGLLQEKMFQTTAVHRHPFTGTYADSDTSNSSFLSLLAEHCIASSLLINVVFQKLCYISCQLDLLEQCSNVTDRSTKSSLPQADSVRD